MTEIHHYFGEDIRLDDSGNLLEAGHALATSQSILRRLCTNPPAYLWHPDYGAGLPARVGTPVAEMALQGLIATQLALEAGIDQERPVTVDLIAQAPGFYLCTIAYTAKGEEGGQILTFKQDGTV